MELTLPSYLFTYIYFEHFFLNFVSFFKEKKKPSIFFPQEVDQQKI